MPRHYTENDLKIVNVERYGAKGDGVTDDTEAFTRAIEESPEGTRIMLSKIYLVNGVRGSAGAARKNLFFVGQGTEATVKIKPNFSSVTQLGTLSGLTYQVKDYLEEFTTNALGWKVEKIQAHTGRIFQFIKVPVKTTIPTSLVVGVILRGKISRLQFEVTGIDIDDPDGLGTARIYFLGATNTEKSQNVLETDVDDITLIENLQVKPYLKKDVWLLDFGVGTISTSFADSRKITQIPSGKVARVDSVYTYTNATGQIKNIVEVSSFHPSQIAKAWDIPISPLNANENLKIEEYELDSMTFGSFNKCENVLFENIHFDGNSYEVGARRMDANDWNIIYTDSVRNITIRNCTFKNSVMTGIHVGGAGNPSSPYSDYPNKVLIDNCIFENNGRNDVEIIYGKNINITNCIGDNSLDIEMNGNEIAESIFISNCSFRELTPYSPSAISSTSEISITNCKFQRVSSQVGAVSKLSNCYIHSLGVYNANAIELTTCTINMINGMYGKSVPTFNNCQIYGLPTDGSASLNAGDKSTVRLNNSIIDLSFTEDNEHGSWAFDFRDSVIISRTRTIKIDKYYTDDESIFHNVEFNNVYIETGNGAHDMKFYNCQFLLKDLAIMHNAVSGWGFGNDEINPNNMYFENCYLQSSVSISGQVTMIDCILDGVSQPTLYGSKGMRINGLKSNLPHGIDWLYVDTPSAGNKVKFNNVYISKNIPSDLGVFGGPSITNVEEGSTALYMDDVTQFAAVMTYSDSELVTQSIRGAADVNSMTLEDDWNLNVKTATHKILYPGGFTEILNQPVGASAFGLLLIFADEDSVSQQYVPHNTNGFYFRTKFNLDDWTDWANFATSEDAAYWNAGMITRQDLHDDNWNLVVQTGTYRVFSTALTTVNRPLGAFGYGMLAVFSSNTAVSQLYFPQDSSQGIYSRTKFNATDWTSWNKTGGSKIESRASDPISPEIGQMWIRSDL